MDVVTKPEAAEALPESGEAPPPSHLRAVLVVGTLALAFALVPRLTHGCEGMASLDEPAPDFKGRVVANPPSAADTTVELSALKGHPVLLDFWATWCGPCQIEGPIVNAVGQRYKDRGLAVVGVNTSDEDGLAAYFVKKKGLAFPIVFDDGNAIAKKFGVSNLPTLVVISKEGKVVARRSGVTSDSDLDELVRRYL